MKLLLISHEVLMILAEVFIIWAVIVARKRSIGEWLKSHKILVTLGLSLVYLSAVAIYSFKEMNSYPHWLSFHSILGTVVILMLTANYLVGFGVAKSIIKNRMIHRTLGTITAFVIVITAITGVVRFVQILSAA